MLLCAVSDASAFYNPTVGRFASRDPIEEEGGSNLFAIARNDPVAHFDLLGLCAPGCDVKSFKITNRKWIGSWPGLSFSGWRYEKRLAVTFELVLKPGSDKKFCRIRQDKQGRTTFGGGLGDVYKGWTSDLGNWWDGSNWNTQAGGSWSGLTLTFKDEPGFIGLKESEFPVYFGSVIGPGHFDFKTFVLDASKSGSPKVAEVNWGIYIEYSTPTKGTQSYY